MKVAKNAFFATFGRPSRTCVRHCYTLSLLFLSASATKYT